MARKEGKILIVDDNRDLLLALKLILGRHFREIHTLNNPNLILASLEKDSFDIVLLDMNFKAGQVSGNEGLFWMRKIRELYADLPVIFITAYGDVELAIRSMKEGAVDFIMKSWDEQKILSTLIKAHELHKSRKEVRLLRKKQAHLNRELDPEHAVCRCQSRAMKELDEMISKLAPSDASVLITGENGTGKEIIARDIHRRSARKDEIFMKVDLGALPESLFESELFGHVRGAFTDARDDREGRFQLASGGTLFLDEIGNLGPALQSKLLSVLQNNEVYPLGASRPVAVNVRVLSATNMPIKAMIGEGCFREDLYYRINALELEIPPLRHRPEDIPLLAAFFLRKYALQYRKKTMDISDKAIRKMQAHSWPGNIRELEHAMEKAVILSEENVMRDFDPGNSSMRGGKSLKKTLNLEDNERELIGEALRLFKGNVSATARELGINRSTLYQKMKKYGL